MLNSLSMYSQYIDNIFIHQKDVFDTTQSDWFFAAKLANSIHSLTKEYIIRDELLFGLDEEINADLIDETERNLRATGLFSSVKIKLVPTKYDNADVYVYTQDQWSLQPYILYEFGGKYYKIGGGVIELNLFGTGFMVNAQLLKRTDNEIGYQGILEFSQRRFLRSPLSLYGKLAANKFITFQDIEISKKFLTLNSSNSYGLTFINTFGNQFSYQDPTKPDLIKLNEQKFTAFYSQCWKAEDRVFLSALLEFDKVDRGKPEFAQAYDNTSRFLLGFSSVSQEYKHIEKINTYTTEDYSIGGWGTAILGKTFALNSEGESLFYLGAQGEQSVILGNLYLFGQVSGASAFTKSLGKYTYQDFTGLAFYRISPDVVFGARIKQQTVWNWFAMRQLVLDNSFGLRGFKLNQLQGDNRIVANMELRYFPDWTFWIFKFSGVLFYDVGSVWNQYNGLDKSRWHSSAGFGIRLHNMKGSSANEVIRFDFAFNLDQKKFAEIIFSTSQLFSFFSSHTFKLPEIYGLEYNSGQ